MARTPVAEAIELDDIVEFSTDAYDEVTFMANLGEGETVDIWCGGSDGWVTATDENGPVVLNDVRHQVVMKGGILYGFTKSATGSPRTVDAFLPLDR